MRRLPIYFLLDVSESMVGENHRKLEEGMDTIVRGLRRDPHALETVYLSAIAFAGKATTIAPLVELVSFYSPKLPLGSGTSLGRALTHLMSEIDKNAVRTTADRKGDWRPIVFLLTDGKPTDAYASAVKRWKESYASKVSLVAIALGRFADLAVLKDLTETVLVLERTGAAEFTKFVAWVTASVSAQSKSVDSGGGDRLALAALDKAVLVPAEDTEQFARVDPDNVVLLGRCQKSALPYLMRYERSGRAPGAGGFDLAGCYPLDEHYFEWSDRVSSKQTVNTSQLRGAPGCPHCGARSAFAMCGCSGLLCIDGPGRAVCPWCEQAGSFGAGDDSFDVGRTRG